MKRSKYERIKKNYDRFKSSVLQDMIHLLAEDISNPHINIFKHKTTQQKALEIGIIVSILENRGRLYL